MFFNSEQLIESKYPLYFEEEESPYEWLSKEIVVFDSELRQMYKELYIERRVIIKTQEHKMKKSTVLKTLSSNKNYINNSAMSREDKIQILKNVYIDYLSDDPIEGSSFDRKILDALDSVKNHFNLK